MDFDAESFADKIQKDVLKKTGFICSVGIAPNLELAQVLMNT